MSGAISEGPPSFMSTVSQVRLNQTSQLKNADEKNK